MKGLAIIFFVCLFITIRGQSSECTDINIDQTKVVISNGKQKCVQFNNETQKIDLFVCQNQTESCDFLEFIRNFEESWSYKRSKNFPDQYCTSHYTQAINKVFEQTFYLATLVDFVNADDDWYDVCYEYIPNNCETMGDLFGRSSSGMALKCKTLPNIDISLDCPYSHKFQRHGRCQCSFDGNQYCELMEGDLPWCDFFRYVCRHLIQGDDLYHDWMNDTNQIVDLNAQHIYTKARAYHHLQKIPNDLFKIFTKYDYIATYQENMKEDSAFLLKYLVILALSFL